MHTQEAMIDRKREDRRISPIKWAVSPDMSKPFVDLSLTGRVAVDVQGSIDFPKPTIEKNTFADEDGIDTAQGEGLRNLIDRSRQVVKSSEISIKSEETVQTRTVDSSRLLAPRESPTPKFKPFDVMPGLGKGTRLKGTGFDLGLELKRFYKDYQQKLAEGLSQDEALDFSYKEMEAGIRNYGVEYIRTRLILPYPIKLGVYDGVSRIVDDYNGYPVANRIDGKERNGAVLEGFNTVEEFMVDAPPGAFAVTDSSRGETGQYNEAGKKIEYTDSYVTVYWKQPDGDVKALTIVTDLTIEQAKQLSINLGVSRQLLSQKSEGKLVEDIMRYPALVSPPQGTSSEISPVEQVMAHIVEVRGQGNIKRTLLDGTEEETPVAEIYSDIKQAGRLLRFSPGSEGLIARLKRTIYNLKDRFADFAVQSEIAREIERTVLSMKLTEDGIKDSGKEHSYYKAVDGLPDLGTIQIKESKTFTDEELMAAAVALKNRPGCDVFEESSTLGNILTKAVRIINKGAAVLKAGVKLLRRAAALVTGLFKDPDQCKECPICGEPIGEIIRVGDACPHCAEVKGCG